MTVKFIEETSEGLHYDVGGKRYMYTMCGALYRDEKPVVDDSEKKDVTLKIWLHTRSLCSYRDGVYIRPATCEEMNESDNAAVYDGGAGVITVNDVPCYVEE